MNDYYKVSFNFADYTETESDILSALLCDIGFETFEVNEPELVAYIKSELYPDADINTVLVQYPFKSKIEYNAEFIPGQDWNEEWEQNCFKPIVLANKCVIHNTMHTDFPEMPYDIVINPKLAFGTGHHETTNMMVERLFEDDLNSKSVLDMGAGTGILSILCSMLGAKYVKGIEIDPVAQINAVENIELNNRNNIDILLGDASLLDNEECKYDLFLANINRNIILNDMERYSRVIKSGGQLQLSGFYKEDMCLVLEKAQQLNFKYILHKEKNNWVVLLLEKL